MTKPVKVVFLGEAGVGKTTLIERIRTGNFFPHISPTIGAAFATLKCTHQGRRRILGLWDTAGSERFNVMLPNFLRGAAIAVICVTTNHPAKFINTILEECNPLPRVLIALTKSDLELKRDYPIGYRTIECSSVNGNGVSELFDAIVTCLPLDTTSEPELLSTIPTYSSEAGRVHRKRCC